MSFRAIGRDWLSSPRERSRRLWDRKRRVETTCPISIQPRPQMNTVSANCSQTSGQPCAVYSVRGNRMAFEIVAERESETVRMKRNSSLIAIAKARVWASEGWNVTIVVGDEDATTLVDEYAPSFTSNFEASGQTRWWSDRLKLSQMSA
jgi:hypothetical protein